MNVETILKIKRFADIPNTQTSLSNKRGYFTLQFDLKNDRYCTPSARNFKTFDEYTKWLKEKIRPSVVVSQTVYYEP